jgi:hypothetical protein
LINLVFIAILLLISSLIGQVESDLDEPFDGNQPDPDETEADLGTNPAEVDDYEPIVQLIKIGIAAFSVLLLGLSISAYKKTSLKGLIYAAIAFGLFAAQLFFDYAEDAIVGWEQPFNEVIFTAMTLGILIFFFLAIVKRK